MRFQYPYILLLLLPVLLLVLRHFKMRHPALKVSCLNHFTGSDGTKKVQLNRYFIIFILEFMALVVLILALARPQTGNEKTTSFKDGVDIVFALDVSGSMDLYDHPEGLAKERQPVSSAINEGKLKKRIDHAKEAIKQFSQKRQSDRLGFIVFGSESYSVCPPTTDHKYLLETMEPITTEFLGDYSQGTNITAAISGGLARLKKSKAKKKIMILVTDGSHTASSTLTPELAAKAAAKDDAIVYTIGIGSNLSWSLRQGFMGMSLDPVKDDFDEDLLKMIAEKTNGQYFSVSSPKELQSVFDSIDELEKIKIEEVHTVNYAEHFQTLLFIALGLLGLAHLLSNSVLMRYP